MAVIVSQVEDRRRSVEFIAECVYGVDLSDVSVIAFGFLLLSLTLWLVFVSKMPSPIDSFQLSLRGGDTRLKSGANLHRGCSGALHGHGVAKTRKEVTNNNKRQMCGRELLLEQQNARNLNWSRSLSSQSSSAETESRAAANRSPSSPVKIHSSVVTSTPIALNNSTVTPRINLCYHSRYDTKSPLSQQAPIITTNHKPLVCRTKLARNNQLPHKSLTPAAKAKPIGKGTKKTTLVLLITCSFPSHSL